MEKTIVFDTGSIISLTSNNLLWTLEPLKKRFGGVFCITRHSKKELFDKPLETKKFEFEALQIIPLLKTEVLSIAREERIYELAKKLYEYANNLVYSGEKPVQIVSIADVEGLAATIILEAQAFVVDERTARLLVEDIYEIKTIMEKKLRVELTVNNDKARELKRLLKNVKIIRSFELVIVAYKLKLLDK